MTEYINKNFYKQIPASERHFIKLSQEAAYAAVKELEAANIPHSATISEYRSIVTVTKADSERAEKIAESAAKAFPNVRTTLGNTEFKYIRDKKYIDTDAETARKIAALLSGNANNRFSGIIRGDKATITVSGDKNAAAVRAMIDNLKNMDLLEALRERGFERIADTNGFVNIRNIQTGEECGFSSMAAVRDMFDTPENEFFYPLSYRIAYREHPTNGDYYYYILKYNSADKSTAKAYRDGNNKPPIFKSVDEALSYTIINKIEITNIDEEIANWREVDREREDNSIIEENRKLIESFPISGGDYIDLLSYNSNTDTFSWVYFNPDGDNGNGEFIDKSITKDDIFAAYSVRVAAESEEQGRNAFIAYLNEKCKENVIEVHSGYFAEYADDYINYASRNFSYFFGIAENSTATSSMDNFITHLELNCEEVIKDKESKEQPQEITERSLRVELDGYSGAWNVIGSAEIGGRELFMLENDYYGDSFAYIVADKDGNVIDDNVWGDFEEYKNTLLKRSLIENAESGEGGTTMPVLKEFADEMKNYGFEVSENDGISTVRREDISSFVRMDIIAEILYDISAKYRLEPNEVGNNHLLDLNRFYDSYDWDGFSEGKNVLENTIIALKSGDFEPIENYIEQVQSVCEVSGSMHFEESKINEAAEHLAKVKSAFAERNKAELETEEKFPNGELSDEGKTAEIPQESNIHFGYFGNGVLCYDVSRLDKEIDDYLSVAHISNEGNIRYYVDDLSESDKQAIENHAKGVKERFTAYWNGLSLQDRYGMLYDSLLSNGTVEQIRAFDADRSVRDINEKVKKYEHSLIFKDEEFPIDNSLKQLRLGDVVDYSNSVDERTSMVHSTGYGVVMKISTQVDDGKDKINLDIFSDKELKDLIGTTSLAGDWAEKLKTVGANYIGTVEEFADEKRAIEIRGFIQKLNNNVYFLTDNIADLDNETAERLVNAFAAATTDGWDRNDNQAKINRIKKALYNILSDEDKTEKAFALISKNVYNYNSDTIKFQFGSGDNGEWFTESELLHNFVKSNRNISFALANAVIGYLDEKQHAEREIDELNAGWYDKTTFSINANIDGEIFSYEGRFDIGDGKGTSGGTLIEHIQQRNEYILKSEKYPYNTKEAKDNAKSILDVFVPFLKKYSEMTPEEMEILVEFKKNNPIRTSINKSEKTNDNFEIYQVKRGDEFHFKRFVSLSALGGSPDLSDYSLAYSGKLSEFGITAENKDDILNNIYSKFNLNIPADFLGHSLSVSDVIVLHTDGATTAHYVDDIGFKDVPDFLTEKTREQPHTLSVGDIVTFADRPNVWRVSAINDLKIDFENTDHNSMDKSFSHIDFGQNREHLQETLKYTLVPKDVSSQEIINADNSINSPMGNFETEINDLVAEKNREAVNKIKVGYDIRLNGELYTVKSIDGDFAITIEPVDKNNADLSVKQYNGNWKEKLIEEAGNNPLSVYSEKLVKEMKKIIAKTFKADKKAENNDKPKKIPNTIPHRNFNKLKKLFPSFMEQKHSYEHYESGEYEPLSAEWIDGSTMSLMHTYLENGRLMRDPDVVLKVDFEKETVNAISFENSGTGIYQEYSDGSKGQKDTNSFMVSWLNNIEVQGFKITRYNDIDGNRIDLKLLNAEKAAAEKYREKTRSKFNAVDGCNSDTIEKMVSEYISGVLSENEIEAEIGEVVLYGSRSRGLENGNSDIDIVVQINSEMKEDALFNVLNEEKYKIGNIDVDINPIRSEETGTLENYLESAERYLENKNQFALRNDRTYIISEIIFETGEVYLVPGVITDDNIAETAAYKEILKLYADRSNIESLDDMIRVNIQTYSYGSGEEYVLSDTEMDLIRENSIGILNQSEEIGNTEFFAHFWKNVDDILNELDNRAAVQHKTSPSLGDGYEEQTYIFTSDYSSDYPDTNSAVRQLKINGEWLDTEEAVKKMNAQGNTDTAQIEALRVNTVSFDGIARNEEMSPEAFHIILDRTNSNMDKMRTAAELYDNKHGDIVPVYSKDIYQAGEAGERELFFADKRENEKCTRSIEYSVSCNNDGFHFNSDKVILDLIDFYSVERIRNIIAASIIRTGGWDKRYSSRNLEWASKIISDHSEEHIRSKYNYGLNSHPVLLNSIADVLRTDYEKYLNMQNETLRSSTIGTPEQQKFNEDIKNLNQLKKALSVGTEFIITDHRRKNSIGERRIITSVRSTGFYSKRPNDENVPDMWLDWGKAGNWNFENGVCTSSLDNNEMVMSFKVLEEDMFNVDTAEIRRKFAERGMVGDEIVDEEKFNNSPFMKQFMQDVENAVRSDSGITDDENSPMGNSAEERHIAAADIAIGDKFLYKGEEVTISSFKGIYPDDVGISKFEKSGSIEYEVTKNVDKFDLARNGIYLGNPDREKSEKVADDTDTPAEPMEYDGQIIRAAVNKLIDNHDFSPETAKFLNRTANQLIINKRESVDPKMFTSIPFRNDYGTIGRIDEKLFDGKLMQIIDELNGYISGKDVRDIQQENTAVEENSPMGNFTPQINDVVENEEGAYKVANISANFVVLLEIDTLLPSEKTISMTDFYKSGFTLLERDETVAANTEKSAEKEESPVNKAENYSITDVNFGDVGGEKSRYAANVEAIKLLKKIETEQRTATAEEQSVLANYTGWGAIPQAFDSTNNRWSNEYAELKELLTPEEYEAARHSTMNAHYTSPTVISAMYNVLNNLGFEKGNILEPAMGTGNFFGVLPEQYKDSKLYGVELDSITGRIAQQLYPNANIQIKGYENTSFLDNSFDVAIGNVPFGDYKIFDKRYNDNNFNIHDYFFAKTLDKVHTGGVIAFITSKGTMDKENDEIRKYIAERAKLLGAIRLPNNAFKATAGTDVTSDILILQKRERPIEITPDNTEWLKKSETADGLSVNNYFVQHPEMVLGKITEGNKLYGNTSKDTSCIPIEGADLKQQLAEAIKNIKGTYKAADIEIKPKENDVIPAPANSRKFSFYAVDGNIYYREAEDTMKKVNVSKDIFGRAMGMIELRDTVHALLNLQLENSNGRLDNKVAECREKLNMLYDSFVAKYGNISTPKNAKAFKGDNGYAILSALETKDENGKVIGKADIFTKNTVKPKIIAAHVETAEEALILSVSEKGKVDFEFMGELCGMEKDKLISELEGQIYKLPQQTEKYVTADEYLSGNIRKKMLDIANSDDPKAYEKNYEALQAAMPPRVEAKDIAVKLGSHWVDPKYIRQFILEKLNPDARTENELNVSYSKVAGTWKIEGQTATAKRNHTATSTYGTHRKNAYEIIEGILNNSDLIVKDRKKDEFGDDMRDEKGNYILITNEEETKAVRHCANIIKSEFVDWIFKDPDRRDELVNTYNEVFNSFRYREYDGSHLNFVGMNTDITLKEHQKNAIARGLYGGNTLLAHAVGAGKSATRSQLKRLRTRSY